MSVRRRLLVLVVASAAAFSSAVPAAQADAPQQAQRQVTVASYNLFLGGDIGALTRATSQLDFLLKAVALWGNVQATDFPARAEAIADLLAADHPDVVGLQEVAKWETASGSAPLEPTYDFLPLLLDALAERGSPYRVLVTNENFVSPEVPLAPLMDLRVKFTDRDVVIARADLPTSQLKASNPAPHTFTARIPLTLPVGSTEIIRGWSSVDVKLRGKTYRFANTHLEAFHPGVRALQGHELTTALDASPYPVVLVGDLNSGPDDLTGPYGMAKAIGLVDSWLTATQTTGDGNTSGQTDSLTNVPSTIDHRIDYVLYTPDGDPAMEAVEAHVIGEELDDRTDATSLHPSLWPSDHAGVVATLHVGRP